MKDVFRFVCCVGILVVTFYLFVTTNPLHAQCIQTNGLYGGIVDCFAVSGTNHFAEPGGDGVCPSTDNGTTWTAASTGRKHSIFCALVVSPIVACETVPMLSLVGLAGVLELFVGLFILLGLVTGRLARIRTQTSSILSLMLAVALGASYGGCSKEATSSPHGETPEPVLSSISMDAPSSSIAIGGTVQIAASPHDPPGRAIAVAVTWSSSDHGVATVSGSGLATGVASGTAIITASASVGATKISASIAINVMPPWTGPVPPRNVMVNDPRRSTFPMIRQFEPSVAVFGSRIVVGWNDESVGGQTIRGVNWSVGYGYSNNGGSTFTDAGQVGTSGWGADPTVTVDRAGNFYFGRIDFVPGSTTADRIAVFKATDGGASFPQSVNAGTVAGSGLNDKPTITADNTGGSFDGNVYASWTFASSNTLKIVFSYSTNGGGSFSAPIFLSDGPLDQGSFPAVGPAGEVYLEWIDRVSNKLFVRKSVDGGVTFAPAVLVASMIPIGVVESATAQYCGAVLKGSLRADSAPIIAVDRSGGPMNGRVYVVFSSQGAGADVYLTSSADGGQTWSTLLQLNDDATTNDQWMPFVVVAPNGAVAVSWYDRRLDPQNLLIDVFMRISSNGGASFGPNLKITEVSFPPPGTNTKLGFPPYSCYFSSYNFMAADDGKFYMVWTDNRMVTSGAVDPNIFFAKIPY